MSGNSWPSGCRHEQEVMLDDTATLFRASEIARKYANDRWLTAALGDPNFVAIGSKHSGAWETDVAKP